MEKPNKKYLNRYINKTNGIPIIDIPNNHINIIYIKLLNNDLKNIDKLASELEKLLTKLSFIYNFESLFIININIIPIIIAKKASPIKIKYNFF